MVNQELLLQALHQFVDAMSQEYDITEMAYELSERVTQVMGAAGAGVSVADRDGDLVFVTATSQVVVEIEQAQQETQEGPCVTAFRTQKPVVVHDIRDVSDWPAYSTVADRLELHSVVGFPLRYKDTRLGALNLYNRDPRDWTEDDVDVVGLFANMTTAFLVRKSELAEANELAEQLQSALDSRIVIEQAKGLLAGEHDISLDDAFDLLRSHSRNYNIRLAEVCNAVVHMQLRIPVE